MKIWQRAWSWSYSWYYKDFQCHVLFLPFLLTIGNANNYTFTSFWPIHTERPNFLLFSPLCVSHLARYCSQRYRAYTHPRAFALLFSLTECFSPNNHEVSSLQVSAPGSTYQPRLSWAPWVKQETSPFTTWSSWSCLPAFVTYSIFIDLFIFSVFPWSTYWLHNIPHQNNSLKSIRIMYFSLKSRDWVRLATWFYQSLPCSYAVIWGWGSKSCSPPPNSTPEDLSIWGLNKPRLLSHLSAYPRTAWICVRITRNPAWRLRVPKQVERERSYFASCDLVLDLLQHITSAEFYSWMSHRGLPSFKCKGEKIQLLMQMW